MQSLTLIYGINALTTIAELLRELSGGGGDVEEFIVSLIAERLDPPRRVEFYLKLSEDYLRNAEELYSKGDLARPARSTGGAP